MIAGAFEGVSGKVPAKPGARPGRLATPVSHFIFSNSPSAWAPPQVRSLSLSYVIDRCVSFFL
jgi:hypothetical protein